MKKLIIFCDYFGNGGIEKIVTYINKNIDKKLETRLEDDIYNLVEKGKNIEVN